MRNLVLATILLSLAPFTAAQQPAPPTAPSANAPSSPSWLHPSEAEYARAIADGFSGKKIKPPYLQLTGGIQTAIGAVFVAWGPLHCAFDMGNINNQKLLAMPDVDTAMSVCDGKLVFLAIHFSLRLGAQWRIVIDGPDGRLQPATVNYDDNPSVETFYAGFLEGNQVGYKYADAFNFAPASAWDGKINVLMADEDGKKKTYILDFGQFAKDEVARRATAASAQK